MRPSLGNRTMPDRSGTGWKDVEIRRRWEHRQGWLPASGRQRFSGYGNALVDCATKRRQNRCFRPVKSLSRGKVAKFIKKQLYRHTPRKRHLQCERADNSARNRSSSVRQHFLRKQFRYFFAATKRRQNRCFRPAKSLPRWKASQSACGRG